MSEDQKQCDCGKKPIVKKRNVFEMIFSTIIILLVSGYFYGVTFTTVPEENMRIVDTILGFLLGSVIYPIVVWAFRSSKAQTDKENMELQVKQLNGKGGNDA
jgi:uncharacterized membrane protein